MQLYNTLTRTKEPFTPRPDGTVRMYVCGITAYDYCHIGHARSAVAFDVLARLLRHKGFDLKFVRNFTDVDDKIINKANEQCRSSEAVAEEFMAAFHEDMGRIGVLPPDEEPRATQYIGQMIDLAERLIAAGKAYATPAGDVYFRVRAFAGYGRLSGRDPDDLRAGARIMPDEEKEDPLDFALWKAAKPGEPHWPSPWGEGRPGWHIECSAMSETTLGLPLDIHGGGLDLIFPHHENEIAQSEAASSQNLARFWVHNGFVQIDAEKMSKSLGNFKTIRGILNDWEPEALRFFLLSKHYRSPIDFSVDGMEEAERGLRRIYEGLRDAGRSLEREAWAHAPAGDASLEAFQSLDASFMEAMDDDCNTAVAIGHVFNAIHLLNRVLDDKKLKTTHAARLLCQAILTAARRWSAILGVLEAEPAAFLERLRAARAKRRHIDPDRVHTLIRERQEARAQKNFNRADAVRAELSQLGVEVRDTPEGPAWDIA
ncbi:MAG: cysteine--tRNA ligase [Deltaproteobacteria bacterium]|nr:cysteine--tRNA ligase [Deltaproteobacteria bacterium]